MSGILLLCRHGNTFNKGEKVFMVGSRNDMELTKEGREQAESLGDALNHANLIPERIIAGPLKRTVEFAEIIRTKLSSDSKSEQSSARIDNRLRELDYGEWEGLSDPEIKARWGEESFKLWQGFVFFNKFCLVPLEKNSRISLLICDFKAIVE